VNLALVGMQQDGTATAAGKVHRSSLAFSTGGAFKMAPAAGAATTLRGIRVVMMRSLTTGGSTSGLSATGAWQILTSLGGAAVGDGITVCLIRTLSDSN
jgi:hypothetical protein